MLSTPDQTIETGDAPELKLAQIETLGRTVIGDMRAMRELLDARTTALEDCREALLAFEKDLLERHADVERREHELCDCYEQREAKLTAREEQCTQTEARLSAEAEQLAAAQAELQQQRSEIDPRLAAVAATEAEIEQRSAALAQREQELATAASALEARTQALEENLSRTRIVEADLVQRSTEVTAAQAELERLREDLAGAAAGDVRRGGSRVAPGPSGGGGLPGRNRNRPPEAGQPAEATPAGDERTRRTKGRPAAAVRFARGRREWSQRQWRNAETPGPKGQRVAGAVSKTMP
jgi:hypothetical protein